MKKLLKTFGILFCVIHLSFTQTIDSMRILPQNPTTEDSVTILCYTTYGASSCNLTSKWIEMESEELFTGIAFHCVYNLLTLCPTVDTFNLPLLNAGEYLFRYYPGFDSLCMVPQTGDGEPVPFPWRRDSIQFTVNKLTSIKKFDNKSGINIYPNPVQRNGVVFISFTKAVSEKTIQINLINGQGVQIEKFERIINSSEIISLNLSLLESGIYFMLIKTPKRILDIKKIVFFN